MNMTYNIKELDKKHKEFTELCRPLIKWLNENHHPHTQIIITPTTCELMEWMISWEVLDYIKG